MELTDISDKVNDLAVLREEEKLLELRLEELLATQPEIVSLQQEIALKKAEKEVLQGDMIQLMKSASLKSWKTNVANISLAERTTVQVSDWFKKDAEKRLEDGEEVVGFSLKTTEYIRIRSNK
jgi:hypothetical protein